MAAIDPVITPLDLEGSSREFMVALGQLGLIERAVYVLHRTFAYPQVEIAAALCLSELEVSRAFQRAVEHLAAHRRPLADTERPGS